MSTHGRVSFSEVACSVSSSASSPLAPSSSPTSSGQVVPLGATRILPSGRRAVNFSPRNDTKYFHSDDSISSSQQITQTRQHPASDPFTSLETPVPRKGIGSSLYRSILKARAHQIRLAGSVEEGTLNNREPARLMISGKRPSLVARDSFELSIIATAGVSETGTGKRGKGKMPQDLSSDDLPSSGGSQAEDAGSEEEEELEEDGVLSTGSLIDIILNGAEDLLTLEEAYNILTLRLRKGVPIDTDQALSLPEEGRVRNVTQPIRDEAPAMVRAIQRDILRLLGKPPSSEPAMINLESSPFRDLRALSPTFTRDRLSPSPTPPIDDRTSSSKSSPRQGYTESEIRYRREASGVGAAVLRLLAFTFHTPRIYSCFSDMDLQSMLDQVLSITRIPKLPTPNPKRTYFLVIVLLAQMRLPPRCVVPMKEKVARTVAKAVMEEYKLKNNTAASDKPGPIGMKKEGLTTVESLLDHYPTIFFPFYTDLLPGCLRGLHNSSPLVRARAGAAASSFARAKIAYINEAQSSGVKSAWVATRTVVQKAEFFVIAHFKSAYIPPGASSPQYNKGGEKKTEWIMLDDRLKASVIIPGEVHWACGTWAAVVTLIGSAYGISGLTKPMNWIISRSLIGTTNTVRPLLARVAWNHALHAYMSTGSTATILENGRLVKSYRPFAATSEDSIYELVQNIQTPLTEVFQAALNPENCTDETTEGKPGRPSRTIWKRSEKPKKLQWLITTAMGATPIIYAYMGTALYSEDLPAKDVAALSGLPSSDADADGNATKPTLDQIRRPRLDQTWEKIHSIFACFFDLKGVDQLTVYAWDLLKALVSPENPQSAWDLDSLIQTAYLGGEAFDIEKESEIPGLMSHLETIGLTVKDIPSFGQSFVAFRMGKWLSLFLQALKSIHNLNNASMTEWIKDEDGAAVIPSVLSQVWRNLLNALSATTSPPSEDTKAVYHLGIRAITEFIIQVYRLKPKTTLVPKTKTCADGQCLANEDRLRVKLVSHLLDAAFDVLGEGWVTEIKLRADKGSELEGWMPSAFLADELVSPAGLLLGQFLRTNYISSPTGENVKVSFMSLIGRIWKLALASDGWKRLLGNITNAAPFLLEGNEELQFSVWKMIATEWTSRIDHDNQSQSQNNHTGNLLVSLLSSPFRGRKLDSYWHQRSTPEDFAIWKNLLDATVHRFRERKAVIHTGLLETLAAHLLDFVEQGEKIICSRITLRCLSTAASYIAFRPADSPNYSQSSPWSADDDRVPADFLDVVNNALEEGYGVESVTAEIKELLDVVKDMMEKAPQEILTDLLSPLDSSLRVWIHDEQGFVNGELSTTLESINLSIVISQCNPTSTRDIASHPSRITSLLRLYSPRALRSSLMGRHFCILMDQVLGQAYLQQVNSELLEAVDKVLSHWIMFFNEMKLEDVGHILKPVPMGMVAWLRDAQSVAQGTLSEKLDSLYRIILTLLSEIIPLHLPADNANLNVFLPLYSSRASFEPTAFYEFWPKTFGGVEGLSYGEETKAFLRDMMEVGRELGEDVMFVPGLSLKTQSQSEGSGAGSPQEYSQIAMPEKTENSGQRDDRSYDADESQLESQTINRRSDLTGSVSPQRSSLLSPVAGEHGMKEDVFGPAGPTIAKKDSRNKATKRPKRRSREKKLKNVDQPALETRSTKNAKRQKTIITRPRDETSDVEDSEEECIVVQPEPEYYVRRGLTPPPETDYPEYLFASSPKSLEPENAKNELMEGADVEDFDDDLEVQVPPTPPSRALSVPETQRDPNGGIFTSAGRWLAKVPSLSFFGATPPIVTPGSRIVMPDSIPDSMDGPIGRSAAAESRLPVGRPRKRKSGQRGPSPKRARSTASVSSTGSGNSGTKQRLVPVVEIPSRANFLSRVRNPSTSSTLLESPVKKKIKRGEKATSPPQSQDSQEEEDEDELLLSPESARRHQKEEAADLQTYGMVASGTQQGSASLSGRFDDAPNDPTPNQISPVIRGPKSAPEPLPQVSITSSPDRRTVQQSQLLSILEEAARLKNSLESMDYEGTRLVLKHLNQIRDAAEKRQDTRYVEIRRNRA